MMSKNGNGAAQFGARTNGSSKTLKSKSNGVNSSSESDSSEKTKNLPPEVRNMISILSRIRKDLLKHIKEANEQGFGEDADYLAGNEQFRENLLGYVSQCGDTSQKLIDLKQVFYAVKSLKDCESLLTKKLPQDLVYKLGLYYLCFNNKANLANRLGDVPDSIENLEKAIESVQDPRSENTDELPLAETYLNLANAHCYMTNHTRAIAYAEHAYNFSSKTAERIQNIIYSLKSQDPEGFSKDNKDFVQLQEQYLGQINLKVMALFSKGQNFEKLHKYEKAIAQFRIGLQIVEQNFGSKHELYTYFANAMGGAKLKTKYDTAEIHRKDQSKASSAVRQKSLKKKKAKNALPPIEKADLKSELFSKVKSESFRKAVRPSSSKKVLRSAQKAIDTANHNAMLRRSLQSAGHHNNLFLTNCDTWSRVHCHNLRGPGHRPRSVRSRQKNASYEKKLRKRSTSKSPSPARQSFRSLKQLSQKKGKTSRTDKDWASRSQQQSARNFNSINTNTRFDSSMNLNSEIESRISMEAKQIIDEKQKEIEKANNCMMHLGDRLHQQQIKQMQQAQDEQFEMLKMVMEHKNQTDLRTQMHEQQQQQMMAYYQQLYYQPQMGYYPGYYNPQMIGQQQYWQQQQGYYPPAYGYQQEDESDEDDEAEKNSTAEFNTPAYQKRSGKKNDQDGIATDRSHPQSSKQGSLAPSPPEVVSSKKSSLVDQSYHSSHHSRSIRSHSRDRTPKSESRSASLVRTKSADPVKSNKSQRSRFNSEHKTATVEDIDSPSVRKSCLSRLSSCISGKSYRASPEKMMNKEEAAIMVQKAWRGYQAREDYKLYQERNNRVPVLKFLKHDKNGQLKQIDCVAYCKKGMVDKLLFKIKSVKGSSSQSFFVDISTYVKVKVLGLGQKLKYLLNSSSSPRRRSFEEQFNAAELQELFKSTEAYDVLQNDEMPVTSNWIRSAQDSEASDDDDDYRETVTMKQASNDEDEVIQRRLQVEQTIQRIKDQCSFKAFKVDEIVVKDHGIKGVDPSGDKIYKIGNAEDTISDVVADESERDFDAEPFKFDRVEIGRKGVTFAENDAESSYDSQRSYRFEAHQPESKVQFWKLKDIMRVQAMIRGFLVRHRMRQEVTQVVCQGIYKIDDFRFHCKLVKHIQENKYVLSVRSLTNKETVSRDFFELPFAEDESAICFEEALFVQHTFGEISEIDLRLDLFIRDFTFYQKEGRHHLSNFVLANEHQHQFKVNLWYEYSATKHYVEVELQYYNQTLHVRLTKLPVEIKYLAYFVKAQIYIDHKNQSSKHACLLMMKDKNLSIFKREGQEYWDETNNMRLSLNDEKERNLHFKGQLPHPHGCKTRIVPCGFKFRYDSDGIIGRDTFRSNSMLITTSSDSSPSTSDLMSSSLIDRSQGKIGCCGSPQKKESQTPQKEPKKRKVNLDKLTNQQLCIYFERKDLTLDETIDEEQSEHFSTYAAEGDDLFIRDFGCLRTHGTHHLKTINANLRNDPEGPYKIDIYYENSDSKHYVGIILHKSDDKLFLKLKNVPVPIKMLPYFLQNQLKIDMLISTSAQKSGKLALASFTEDEFAYFIKVYEAQWKQIMKNQLPPGKNVDFEGWLEQPGQTEEVVPLHHSSFRNRKYKSKPKKEEAKEETKQTEVVTEMSEDNNDDLFIRDFTCFKKPGKFLLKTFSYSPEDSFAESPYTVQIFYVNQENKHIISVQLDTDGQTMYLNMKNVPVAIKKMAYFIKQQVTIDYNLRDSTINSSASGKIVLKGMSIIELNLFNKVYDELWERSNRGRIGRNDSARRKIDFEGWLDQKNEESPVRSLERRQESTERTVDRPQTWNRPSPKTVIQKPASMLRKQSPSQRQSSRPSSKPYSPQVISPTVISPKTAPLPSQSDIRQNMAIAMSKITSTRQDNPELTYLLCSLEMVQNGVKYYVIIQETTTPQKYYLTVNNIDNRADSKSMFFHSDVKQSELKEYIRAHVKIIVSGGVIAELQLGDEVNEVEDFNDRAADGENPAEDNKLSEQSDELARLAEERDQEEFAAIDVQPIKVNEQVSEQPSEGEAYQSSQEYDNLSRTSMHFENEEDKDFNFRGEGATLVEYTKCAEGNPFKLELIQNNLYIKNVLTGSEQENLELPAVYTFEKSKKETMELLVKVVNSQSSSQLDNFNLLDHEQLVRKVTSERLQDRIATPDLTGIHHQEDHSEQAWSEKLEEFGQQSPNFGSSSPKKVTFENSAKKIQANYRGKMVREELDKSKRVTVQGTCRSKNGAYLRVSVDIEDGVLRVTIQNIQGFKNYLTREALPEPYQSLFDQVSEGEDSFDDVARTAMEKLKESIKELDTEELQDASKL